jgi:hypothetical protein
VNVIDSIFGAAILRLVHLNSSILLSQALLGRSGTDAPRQQRIDAGDLLAGENRT